LGWPLFFIFFKQLKFINDGWVQDTLKPTAKGQTNTNWVPYIGGTPKIKPNQTNSHTRQPKENTAA